MGWIAGAKAAIEGVATDLIAVDPVGIPGVAHDAWPVAYGKPVFGLVVRAGPTPFITQLDITGDSPAPLIFGDVGHNELAHDSRLFKLVADYIAPPPPTPGVTTP